MNDKGELRAKYIFPDDYEPDYVTGAIGNIQPNGDLVINFFAERLPIPYETVQVISENGRPEGEISVTDPNPSSYKLRRTVKNGVVMSKATAVSIYQWMKGQLLSMGVNADEL